MAGRKEKYLAEANEAISLRFPGTTPIQYKHSKPFKNIDYSILSTGESECEEYHPDFSYPFFGEEELIYGMADLQVSMEFSPASLRPLIEMDYSSNLKSVDPVKTVVEPILDKMYPQYEYPLKQRGKLWTDSRQDFERWVIEDEDWKPVGEKVHQYELNDQVFEVYCGRFEETPGLVEYHRRLQTFLWWFIEGCSYIEETDVKWQIYSV